MGEATGGGVSVRSTGGAPPSVAPDNSCVDPTSSATASAGTSFDGSTSGSTVGGPESGEPQVMQNFAPSSLSVPQEAQRIVDPFTTSWRTGA